MCLNLEKQKVHCRTPHAFFEFVALTVEYLRIGEKTKISNHNNGMYWPFVSCLR